MSAPSGLRHGPMHCKAENMPCTCWAHHSRVYQITTIPHHWYPARSKPRSQPPKIPDQPLQIEAAQMHTLHKRLDSKFHTSPPQSDSLASLAVLDPQQYVELDGISDSPPERAKAMRNPG